MRLINKIYIHCSDSLWGDLEEITKWHTDPPPRGRGFINIGYHFLITNQFPFYSSLKDDKPEIEYDGKIFSGRPIKDIGAHTAGDNKTSIGICLVGVKKFTPNQFASLALLVKKLINEYNNIKLGDVLGHYEFWERRNETPLKKCPCFNMQQFRQWYFNNVTRNK